jgi:hypothetical protein
MSPGELLLFGLVVLVTCVLAGAIAGRWAASELLREIERERRRSEEWDVEGDG